jgi:dipeptidyl aminopeptidase/acylaminoacyl peptidase
VSAEDPLGVLVGFDRPVEPRREFADALLASCLAELMPATAPARRRIRRGVRLAVAVVGVLLALAGIATATYLALRPAVVRNAPRPGQLTVILGSARSGPTAKIAAVDAAGRLRVVWRCPEPVFCGELTSVAWAPNGRRLALTLDEIGGTSGYVGLHVVDLRTGHDLHIPSLPIPHISRPQPRSVGTALAAQARRRLGCDQPIELAWSPGSARLAYVCSSPYTFQAQRTSIRLIHADGTGQAPIRTGTRSAYWPSWSPDGKLIAFSTQPAPRVSGRTSTEQPKIILHSSVWIVALDGSFRRRIAIDGAAPSWSPDGKTIAYESSCGGVRLVALDGTDKTPGAPAACPHIGVRGLPTWSPDGAQIAIGGPLETYVVRPDGTGLRRLTSAASRGVLGGGRPAWAPLDALKRIRTRKPQGGY